MAIRTISGFNTLTPIAGEATKIQADKTGGASFADYLKNALNQVTDLENQANDITNAFATGQTDNIHDVMIASEKADIALQFTMQIRNKVMDAYSEIMRMQV